MAQRKQLTWSELRVGVFIVMGIVLLVVAISTSQQRRNALAQVSLGLVCRRGRGPAHGADVTLDGIVVGDVEDYRVNPVDQPPNPNRSIEIIMRINKKFQQDIRTDSLLTLDTEGLLGNRYVNITRGFTGTMLAANQEVPSQEEKGMKEIEERGAELAENLNTLAQQIQTIVTDVNKGRGTLGKLLNDDSVYNHLDSATSKIDSMIGACRRATDIWQVGCQRRSLQQVNSATGRADDVLAAVQQQKGSLGKFIYDPALHTEATQLMQKGNTMLDDIHAGKGTLGKLATDDSLFQEWKQTGANLSTLSSKLNRNDGTAGKFS